MPKLMDLTGQRFGFLTALKLAPKDVSKTRKWECICDCGNTAIVTTSHLRSGHTKSCGCLSKKSGGAPLKYDETNNRYGRLLVIRHVGGGYWLCKCDCGQEGCVSGTDLRAGKTQSCGCLQKELLSQRTKNNLIGRRFGKLTVIQEDIERKYGKIQWLCKCDCGNELVVAGNSLLTGNTQSCGCTISHGENIISSILTTNNIMFKTQYTFDDLRGENNGVLRFDFAIFKDKKLSHLIEFDGEQHFDPNNSYYTHLVPIHDKKKNDYCLKHNIKLIRIPYTQKDNITLQLLMGE